MLGGGMTMEYGRPRRVGLGVEEVLVEPVLHPARLDGGRLEARGLLQVVGAAAVGRSWASVSTVPGRAAGGLRGGCPRASPRRGLTRPRGRLAARGRVQKYTGRGCACRGVRARAGAQGRHAREPWTTAVARDSAPPEHRRAAPLGPDVPVGAVADARPAGTSRQRPSTARGGATGSCVGGRRATPTVPPRLELATTCGAGTGPPVRAAASRGHRDAAVAGGSIDGATAPSRSGTRPPQIRPALAGLSCGLPGA